MRKINSLKIAYSLLIMSGLLVSIPSVCALETIKANEIKVKNDEVKKDPSSINNYVLLGEEDNKEGKFERPEFELKNWGEYIKKKEPAKASNGKNSSGTPPKKEEDMIINCEEMEYFDETGDLEARDKVEIITNSGAKVYADKAIYNREENTIKLINNVTLLKGGTTIVGDYMLVDLNEENAIMDEPTTKLGALTIKAKEGYAYSDKIENLNGNVEINRRVEMELYSQGFSTYGRAINDKRLVDFDLKTKRSKPYKFKTKEIVIRPERDHDSMIMKNVDIYYEKRKILNVPSIEIFQDKEMTYSEINFPPEIGSIKGFGMYAGLGYTFKLPKTFTFRATPAIVYGEDELGYGAIAQLKSKRTRTEFAWASNTDNILFDGNYKITDQLSLDLGRHVYKNEWINGGTRAGYIAELAYDDAYTVNELGGAIFRHRLTGGYVADYKRKHQEKNMKDGFRYRYQAELKKNLKTFENEEQDMMLSLNAVGQIMASVYSETGDTVGLFRVGPTIISKVKRWNSSIAYTMGGVHGKSPYWFDEYRYGRQTVSFDESLILNRFLSLGYRGTLSPLKDNYAKDILTENRLYAVVGPEDVKIAFSYDTIRQNMYFDFLFLLGSDSLNMQYDKLIINNPEKIGKHQRRESDKALNKIQVPEEL